MTNDEKQLLVNASRLIWSKGTINKAEAVVAVNFQDWVEGVVNEKPAAAAATPEPEAKKGG